MRRFTFCLLLLLASSCSTPVADLPSLAARSAETIDPRLPIEPEPSPGTLDPALAASIAEAVASARAGVAQFERMSGAAEALAVGAGPAQGESWIVAQQALSALVAQHGATTRAAADIDALAAMRIDEKRWLVPANRAAIEEAAADVKSINDAQSATIDRLSARLGN